MSKDIRFPDKKKNTPKRDNRPGASVQFMYGVDEGTGLGTFLPFVYLMVEGNPPIRLSTSDAQNMGVSAAQAGTMAYADSMAASFLVAKRGMTELEAFQTMKEIQAFRSEAERVMNAIDQAVSE